MNAISPFGAVLREIRTARGMSQGTLAKRTHYSKGYLSRVENGLQQMGSLAHDDVLTGIRLIGDLITEFDHD